MSWNRKYDHISTKVAYKTLTKSSTITIKKTDISSFL